MEEIKWESRLQLQMKEQIFDPIDTIPIIRLLHAFNIACYNYDIHERVALWLLPYFMEKSTTETLAKRS